MTKATSLSIILCIGIIFGAVYMTQRVSGGPTSSTVHMEQGIQVIDITANNGYSPEVIAARAGMPTTLRVLTKGTYDCTASLVIPSLGYQKLLVPTGTEEIAISAEKAVGTLNGACGMGMKSFKIIFGS